MLTEGKEEPEMADDERRETQTPQQQPTKGELARRKREFPTPPRWVYTWGRVFRIFGFPFVVLYRIFITRTLVIGAPRLEELRAPVIFAGTHHSFLDMSLVRQALAQTAAKRLGRNLVVAASVYGLATAGLFAWYAVLAFGLFPIRRHGEGDGERSLREIGSLMRAGDSLLIFPQGHHVRPEQERAGDPSARFREGASRLAAGLAAPVVPFGLAGTEKAVPPSPEGFAGTVIAGIPVSIKRRPLAIAFGEPARFAAGESVEAFTERLQAICYWLTREAEEALTKLEVAP